MSLLSEIKQSYKHGNILTKFIYINVLVFLGVKIVELVSFFFRIDFINPLLNHLMLPANVPTLMLQPWTLFTYMFLHQGFLHVLFNLLWLYWIGLIFVDFLNGKRFIAVYFFGGLSGAAFYILIYNLFPVFNVSIANPCYMMGASASVMAIALATAMYVPDYTLYLVLIGPVKLKWIAFAMVVLDVITIAGDNPGGHIAHLGGALYGLYWGYRLKNGKDITKWLTKLFDKSPQLFAPKRNVKVSYVSDTFTGSSSNNVSQKEIDAILDKIAKSGYESLSASEKEQLFKASKK